MQFLSHTVQIIKSGKPAFLTSPTARTAFARMMFYVCFVTSLSACGGGSSENLAADVPVVYAPSAAPSPAPTPTIVLPLIKE
jgi:hypothetical protein